MTSDKALSSSPAVSVIVPAFNAERFLCDCIDSILAQTFADFELIIINDGSTDFTPAIISRYAMADCRVRAISQDNKGLSAARNSGLDHAGGSYITFVDADDMLHPYFLETLLSEIRRNPGTDIAACAWSSREIDGKPVWKRPSGSAISPCFNTMSGTKAFETMLYQTSRLRHNTWGKLYASSLWENLRFPDGWFEDLNISVDLFPKARNIAFTPEALYFYRRHNGNFTRRKDATRIQALYAAVHITEVCDHRYPSLCTAAYDRLLSASFNLLLIESLHPGTIDKSAETICLANIRRHRFASLFGRRVRIKNRIGAFLSYIGGLQALRLINALKKQ